MDGAEQREQSASADPPAKRPRTDEPARPPAAPVVALAYLSAEEKQARHIAPIRR